MFTWVHIDGAPEGLFGAWRLEFCCLGHQGMGHDPLNMNICCISALRRNHYPSKQKLCTPKSKPKAKQNTPTSSQFPKQNKTTQTKTEQNTAAVPSQTQKTVSIHPPINKRRSAGAVIASAWADQSFQAEKEEAKASEGGRWGLLRSVALAFSQKGTCLVGFDSQPYDKLHPPDIFVQLPVDTRGTQS